MNTNIGDRGQHRVPFSASGSFVFRTPLLPYNVLLDLSQGLLAADACKDPNLLEAALLEDRRTLRARLRSLVDRPEIKEALFIASPTLENDIKVWQSDPEGSRGQKIERALVRYITRMASRATPFGLFAGCSLGRIDMETCLHLGERQSYRRCTRLDGDYLDRLSKALLRHPELRRTAILAPNSGMYRIAGWWRYPESREQGQVRTYRLEDVRPSAYLDDTLERARGGSSRDELLSALMVGNSRSSEREADAFLDELVSTEILCSTLTPVVTGADPLEGYLRQLCAVPAAAPFAHALKRTQETLTALDEQGVGADLDCYHIIEQTLEALPTKVERARLIQVDMFKPAPNAVLGRTVMKEITRGIEILHRISPVNARSDLQRFRKRFRERYEDQEVPLVEALDEDLGIGFDVAADPSEDASKLLHGLDFPMASASSKTPWGSPESHLLRRLESVIQEGLQELVLDEDDLLALEVPNRLPLPDAFAVTATIAAGGRSLARDDFHVLLENITGPSGVRLVGRFCHLDESLYQLVQEHLRAEEALRPDAIFAEIVHLPEGRIGNILTRPVLRAYEIPYLGHSGSSAERQIPVTDLLISVKAGKIVLRSKRLGREVIPRLTTAHSFSDPQNLGVYRFLCALQGQDVATFLGWKWGPFEDLGFLPRVVSGRLVLARACWNVRRDQWRAIVDSRGAERFRRMQALRTRLRLPRLIALRDKDNVLPIDLDNVLSVESLVHLVKDRAHAALIEHYPSSDDLCVHGPEGRFTHELVIPFVRNESERSVPRIEAQRPLASQLIRCFTPGSEWIYAKFYTGTATADRVLRDELAPLLRLFQSSGQVDRWFFIRYEDPEWHLRLRLHGRRENLSTQVLPMLASVVGRIQKTGMIWRFQLDTYHREVERYGGADGILLAEEIFHVDSEAALAVIQRFSGVIAADVRWKVAIRGCDILLSDLGIDLEGKLAVVSHLRAARAQEYLVDGTLQSQLSAKYRENIATLERIFRVTGEGDTPLDAGLVFLRRRSRQLAPIIQRLRALQAEHRLSSPISTLAASYIHMHVNRMLRSAVRAQELVLYEFLYRYYRSRLARSELAPMAKMTR